MSNVMFRSLVVRASLLIAALLTLSAAAPLGAQQTQVQAPAITAPAPTVVATPTPAPASSPLFARSDNDAPTIANARADNAAAMNEGGNHTIVVSTLVLVLGVIILVLLID